MSAARQWFYNVFVAADQLANTLIGGAPSDTISGRSERGYKAGSKVWTLVHNILDKIQPNHSEMALKNDEAGRHVESFKLDD